MDSSFQKRLWTAIVIYILLALVLAGVTWWLGFDISRRVTKIISLKSDLAFRSSASEALTALRAGAAQAQNERLFIENLLPPQDRLIDFPRDIQGLAKQHKVDTSFSFGQEAPGQINFNLITKSDINNWLRFLQALEGSRYLIGFEALNLSDDGKIFQSTINGKIFSQ